MLYNKPKDDSSKTLVFLHGFLESLDIWKNFYLNLSKAFRVVCIDLPGHGNSGMLEPEREHSMDNMAEMVNEVLKTLNIKDCVLIGHSMGGYVGLSFMNKYPDMLRGLCLFHSHAKADTDEIKNNRDKMIDIVSYNHTQFIKNFIPNLYFLDNIQKYTAEIEQQQAISGNTSKESIIAALNGMKDRVDYTSLLAKTQVPVLFIVGKNDSRINFNEILEQIGLPSHSEALILDKVGHVGFVEAKLKTLLAVSSFAQKSYLYKEFN
ncbi:MAG: hypothetical protein A2X12_11065 [Bacteroidetes bacterium GWE2_29_8]|nr:MAG: hypothetical protein A2X12_11065 [Bacteroidetes bacterium GWE2_29_8]OFY22349.1 MAG: hypothetical protein A2X02_07545 [Bacteroidetes bacterium GWF2_29_10]